MPGKANSSEGQTSLRELVECTAASVRDRLVARSREGDLDILTFLDMIEERIDSSVLQQHLGAGQTGQIEIKALQSLMLKADLLSHEMREYLVSEDMKKCIQLAIDDQIDQAGFQSVKEGWKYLRKALMMDVKLKDTELLINFVLVECVGRMLLVWHEQLNKENSKKNLKLIDHLLVRFDMNGRLKGHLNFVSLMHMLGQKYGNISLKSRLKDEGPTRSAQESLDKRPPVAEAITATPKNTQMQVVQLTSTPVHIVKQLNFGIRSGNKSQQESAAKSSQMFDHSLQLRNEPNFGKLQQIANSPRPASLSERHSQSGSPRPQSLAENGSAIVGQDLQLAGPMLMAYQNMDTSFLSEKSESSISFMDNDEKRGHVSSDTEKEPRSRRSVAGGSIDHASNQRKGFKQVRKEVQVEEDVREVTREKFLSRLMGMIGESKAKLAARGIEAQLFSSSYLDEKTYDVKYCKIITFLESLTLVPSLISPLLDHYFDLEFILSRADTLRLPPDPTLGKRSVDKTTQTLELGGRSGSLSKGLSLNSLDKLTTTACPLDSSKKMLAHLREDETTYLRRAVQHARQESDLLRKTVYEMRLGLPTSAGPQDSKPDFY